MARINTAAKHKPLTHTTHEGAPAKRIDIEAQLRRSVMACMLWEDGFYENRQTIAERIKELVHANKPGVAAEIAVQAREKTHLRHAPLLIVRELARHPNVEGRTLTGSTLERVIQRADELSEFLSIYWKEGRQRLSAQVKKGLARAFTKFSAYDLAKYDQKDRTVKLRDVLFLCHAKPKDEEQAAVWKRLIKGTLESPDTWEVALSAGNDKCESWIRLIEKRKLGGLAFLRNLRNMQDVKVPRNTILKGFETVKFDRVLPFRFIAAARYAPMLEPKLEEILFRNLKSKERLKGSTVVLIDVSGSMDEKLSAKSDMTRLDAACGVGMIVRELVEEGLIFTFSNQLIPVPPRHGFALRDAIVGSQDHGATRLGAAISGINQSVIKYERLIVITDEQAHDAVPGPKEGTKGYLINVSANKNGVGYGKWVHLDGFSEAVIDYIVEYEKVDDRCFS